MDDQKPRDVFFFEQDGAFVLRLLMSGQAGSRHELAEFTRDDIDDHGRPRPEPRATRRRSPEAQLDRTRRQSDPPNRQADRSRR